MSNIYKPISRETTILTFTQYIDMIDLPEINYFAIGMQNKTTKESTSLMSLTEWQNFFTENNLAGSDPIRKIALHTTRNIIPFKEIDYVDNFGKEIMRQRALLGIKDGLILMKRLKKHNFMITLGTSYSSFNPYDFIKKYHDTLQVLKNDLINLIQKEAIDFLPANHLSTDAK